jgi:lipoprotein-anchoring transpeptidase ErfK/SrfK
MLNRRGFIASGLLAGAVGLSPAFAKTKRKKAKPRKKYVLPKKHQPRVVRLWTKNLKPGELHIFPREFALYYTLPRRKAIRYSVGVGRKNLYEAGTFFIGAKKEWPAWTPTKDMIKREPKTYAKYAKGMPGGIRNPLGARALYLFTKKRGDTFLRIHGTNNPRTIGFAVSNGCVRLVNDQIVELYNRIPMDTKVVLHPK